MLNLSMLLLSIPGRGQAEVTCAVAHLLEAEDRGCAEASYRLGCLYSDGVHGSGVGDGAIVWPHPARARTHFEAAARLQHGPAAFRMATHCLQEVVGAEARGTCPSMGWQEKSLHFLTVAATQGIEEAQMLLAAWFLEGGRGVDRNEEAAVMWYQAAAEQHSNAEAQAYMALCYELGDGVEEDLSKALELYRSAAEQGHPEAQFSLGEHASHFKEAVRWYTRAADQGHANAMWKLALCYQLGEHQPVAQGTRRLKPSAQAAQEAIAKARQNPTLAASLAADAAALGSEEALRGISLLQEVALESVGPATPVKSEV